MLLNFAKKRGRGQKVLPRFTFKHVSLAQWLIGRTYPLLRKG